MKGEDHRHELQEFGSEPDPGELRGSDVKAEGNDEQGQHEGIALTTPETGTAPDAVGWCHGLAVGAAGGALVAVFDAAWLRLPNSAASGSTITAPTTAAATSSTSTSG